MTYRILLVLLLNCLFSVHAQTLSITNWLASLPEVGKIESIEVSHPDCTLIYIRQFHYAPEEYSRPKGLDEEGFLGLLSRVHSDIFNIGTNIQSRFNLSSYYAEGCTEKDISESLKYIEYVKKLRQLEKEVYTAGDKLTKKIRKNLQDLLDNPLTITNKVHRESIRSEIIKMDKQREYILPPYGNATQPHQYRLAVEANMHLNRTEDSQYYNRVIDMLFHGNPQGEPFESFDEMNENRNTATLGIIAEDYKSRAETNHVSLLIYGADHDFGKSAKVWNATNDFKFTVITVTPKSVIESHP